MFVEECDSWFNSDSFKQLFSSIGRNSQNISTSPLSVWVKNVSNLKITQFDKTEMDKYIDKIYEDIDNGWFEWTFNISIYTHIFSS